MNKSTLVIFVIAGILVLGLLYADSISGNLARSSGAPTAPAGPGDGGSGAGSGSASGSSPNPSASTQPSVLPSNIVAPSNGQVKWKDLSNVKQTRGTKTSCNSVCNGKCVIGQDVTTSEVISCSTTRQNVNCMCFSGSCK